MSIHPTLRGVDTLKGERSVLTRQERLTQLKKAGKFEEAKRSVYGLPKVRTKFKVAGAKKKAAKEAAPGATAPGAAPAAGAKGAAGGGKAAAGGEEGRQEVGLEAAPERPADPHGSMSVLNPGESASDAAARTAAPVMEVFASIQGEGAFMGEPQAFLRLRGCPVRCRWCDTPGSLRVSVDDRARIAASAERGGPRREDPWATPFRAACWIAEVEPGAARTVSVTGGEPLMWPEFLLGLKSMLSPRRVHLETAGAHPRTLARVIDAFDHVSLDLKPDGDLDAPVELAEGAFRTAETVPRTRAEWRAAREACLALVSGRDACGKIVVSGERSPDDLAPLLDEVEKCAPGLTVYLQPATPMGGCSAPTAETLALLVEMARDRDLAVRVVPQVHRALGIP